METAEKDTLAERYAALKADLAVTTDPTAKALILVRMTHVSRARAKAHMREHLEG